jgi:NAD(P)-dependent dehydrogenase (short-subunit alcohol dehydrogenase family)
MPIAHGGIRLPWTTREIPDLGGRTAVVTGANGGLGLETASALAAAGAHVVMAARSPQKVQAAHDRIVAMHPHASLEPVELDLASIDAVHRAAEAIAERHGTVDILVNNAGVMAMPERRTTDGFEMQLGVNHLGHWVLTADLLPRLLAADAARVVTVTSYARLVGRRLDARDPSAEGRYAPWAAYARSKIANHHFGLGLQRRFVRAGVRAESLVAHPGLSHTGLQVRTVAEGGGGISARFWAWLAARVGMAPAMGALPLLRAATDPRARGGELYAPRFLTHGVPVRRPIIRRWDLDRAIDELWDVSTRMTGVPIDLG